MRKIVIAALVVASAPAGDKISRLGEYSGYSTARYSAWVRASQYLPMRDGVKLAVDIYRPSEDGRPVATPYPVVWEHNTSRGTVATDGKMQLRAARAVNGEALVDLTKFGYVVVEVDRRGLGASFGSMKGYHNRAESEDAYEITEWLAAQPWSDGNVGMFGCSNTGETVMHAVGVKPPHLKAVFPGCFSWNKYDGFLRGGILANWGTGPEHPYTEDLNTVRADEDSDGSLIQSAARQHQGNTSLYQLWKGLPFRDSWSDLVSSRYWMEGSVSTYQPALERLGIPIYGFSGWYDDFRKEVLIAHAALHNPGKVLIGPWGHCQNDGFKLVTERLRFFDRYLKNIDNGIDREPAIAYYTVGAKKGQEWRQTAQWPLQQEKPTRFYLGASNTLSQAAPTARDGADSATVNYNVACPQRTSPLSQTCVLDAQGLTYTTSPLAADVELTGHPVFHLWASTSAKDLNFFAYLEDVSPEGKVSIVTDGRLRSSLRALGTPPYAYLGLPWHRGFQEDSEPMKPGEPAELVFDLLPLSQVFPKDHLIRVTITNADPREKDRLEVSPAPQVRIYRGKSHPSFVVLPVI